MINGIAYIDDAFVPIADAKIPVLDWGFLHSDATYDVVHVWNSRFFRLDAHLRRFTQSIERLHLTLPVEQRELQRILAECVSRSGLRDAYVEMIVTRGMSPTFSRDPRYAENRLICFAIPFGWILPPEERKRGLSISISNIQRIPPESVDPRAKNYHWLDFILGLYDAYDRGSESVVLSDADGNVTEGPGFNVFAVTNGTIATPSRGILQGVTRQTAIDLARELSIPVSQRIVSASEMRSADEVFATSTAGGIMPITKVDGVFIGNGEAGNLTTRLLDRYWDKHEDPNWSVPVGDLL